MEISKNNNNTIKCPAKNLEVGCVMDECAAWRWIPILANEPSYMNALKLAETGIEGKTPHLRAAKLVKEDLEKYGFDSTPWRGFCGLGPEPIKIVDNPDTKRHEIKN